MAVMIRQGDVLLIPVAANSTRTGEKIKPESGRVILAHGEATGHAHAVSAKLAALFAIVDSADRMLRVSRPAKLQHEEHGHIPLPIGDYVVRRQKEYTPVGIRNVTD